MKIAILGTAYPFRGGLSAYNERLTKQLVSDGHEVKIFTFTTQYPNFLFPGQSQFSTDPAPNELHIERAFSSVNPASWSGLGRQLKKDKYDLILVKFWLPFMGPSFGTILRIAKRNKHTKVICIVDNMIPHESRIGDKRFTKYFVKPIDGFIAMSDTVLNDISVFDTEKPRLLSPHPVYDNFGALQERDVALKTLGLDPTHKYLLFFGLVRDYKGLDLLLHAFSDKRFDSMDLRLIVAGEYYSDKEKYLQIISDHNLDDSVIQVSRFIPDSEVAHFFNAADLIVQPYKNATQSGVTQIAYHFEKPMIVTNVGGLKEMCPDGKVGYVVEPEPKAIADAIVKYFDATDQQKMLASIQEEKKKFGWDILTDNIQRLYKKISL